MNRIRLINHKLKKIIIIIILLNIIYIYFLSLSNENIRQLIETNTFMKYKKDKIELNKDRIIYNSLNKIISYSDLIKSNTIESKEIVKIKNKEIKVEHKEYKSNKKVYIYNTHDTEKYKSLFVSDYSITPNVKLASYILKDYLNDLGVESYVQNKSISSYLKKHNLGYTGSYEASREYMKTEFNNNKYDILIDLHRDSSKHKYTLYTKNNKKYAKVMFVLTTKHKNYKYNEKFANNLNNRINKKYKGLSRGIMKRKDVIFNQDMSKNAILIELGGVDNTLEEINNTLKVLAEIIVDYIKEDL